MSDVVGKLGCCSGGCGEIGAHIRRTFPGWKRPMPGDFGEWMIATGATSEEVNAWSNRSAAYAMADAPWSAVPESWGPPCSAYQPVRYLNIHVKASGTYIDKTDPQNWVILNWDVNYRARRKKEIWYTDELTRTGLSTEEYWTPETSILSAERNENNGAWINTGQRTSDINQAVIDYPPFQSTYWYDLFSVVSNPLGGSARLVIEDFVYFGEPAVRIIREIYDPAQFSDTITVNQLVRQEVVLFGRLTFDDFEAWLNDMLDEVRLDDLNHVYPANTFYANDGNPQWNVSPMTIGYGSAPFNRFEPFYSSRENNWPNRIAIDFHTSFLWYDADYTPVVAIRHTVGDGLQLFRRRISRPGPLCLISYEYAEPPAGITAGLSYSDSCPVSNEVQFALKTGMLECEPNAWSGGTKIFYPEDMVFANGIMFLGAKDRSSFTLPNRCYTLGGLDALGNPIPLSAFHTNWPNTIGSDLFLDELSDLASCCYSGFPL